MAERRHFGSIRRLGSGRFQARYTDPLDGRKRSLGTFPKRTYARQALAKLEVAIATGSYVDSVRRSPMPRFDEWSAEELSRRALRDRTRETYESQLRRHILPSFGAALLDEISPLEVVRWHDQMRTKGLSPDAVASNYRLLRSILQRAVAVELIARNPALIRGASAVPTHDLVVPTLGEVDSIASALPPPLRAVPWVAALSGARKGELFALRRSDIDLAAGVIRIERQLQWPAGLGPCFVEPKTTAGRRSVAAPKLLVTKLHDHVSRFCPADVDGLVFARSGGRPMQYPWFDRRWHAAVTDAGIGRKVRLHDLRHLAATLMAEAGASQRALMAQMGHSTGTMALRYMHVTPEHQNAIAAAIDARLDGSLARMALDAS